MKLSTAAAIIATAAGTIPNGVAARSIISPLSGVNLFPRFKFEVEVNAAHANSIDGLGSLYDHSFTRAYGTASLYPDLLSQIGEKVGRDNISAAALGAVRQVQTLRLTETSPWHTDCEMDGPHRSKSLTEPERLQVGFLFLNTNEDAYFETDDGKLCTPVKKGNFVSFDGRMPHRSVVKSGHIDMIGPFLLSSDRLSSVQMLLQAATESIVPIVQDEQRQLSTDNSGNIEGKLVMGDITDREKYPVGDYFVALKASGLPPDCTTEDCAMAVAVANSRECTMKVHDSASKVLLSGELFYTTDDKGNTNGNTNGWEEELFSSSESGDSPVSLSEVFTMVNVAGGAETLSQLVPVVYLYDKEKMPIACAFLESPTDEQKETFDKLFNEAQDEDNVDSSGASDAAAADVVGGGNNGAGGVALLPQFVMSVIIMTGALVLW